MYRDSGDMVEGTIFKELQIVQMAVAKDIISKRDRE